YSLAYSGDAGGKGYIGDLARFGMMGIEHGIPTAYAIPEVLYCFFQFTFAACTVAIAVGGAAGRGRMLPMLIWQFFWVTIVYSPLAHWVWSPNGWVYKLGTLDYAGGTPVHVASGASGLAYSLYLSEIWKKKEDRPKKMEPVEPHNPMHVLFATIILWGGWIGFDGAGGNVAMNIRSVMAASTTNLSAACGAVSWAILDYLRTKRWSIVSACSGAIAGLVGITPACGFVGHPAAMLIGFLNGVVCNYATGLKNLLGFEDPVDVVGMHLVGGIVGNLMTGLFAQASVAAVDGITEIPGGAFLDGNWIQIGYQLADTTAATLYAFGMSFFLCFLIDCVPGLKLRASEESIRRGCDLEEMMEPFLDRYDSEDLPCTSSSFSHHAKQGDQIKPKPEQGCDHRSESSRVDTASTNGEEKFGGKVEQEIQVLDAR
ncbi:Rh-like protein/ammonium transporter, partial [Violaceomyces palustris]